MKLLRLVAHAAALAPFLGCVASPLQAQEERGHFPSFGDHRFSPNRLVQDPWVKSYGMSVAGLGTAFDPLTPPAVIGGDTIPALEGDLVYATFDIEYQQRIADWFAFRLSFGVDARLGTEAATLLARGVNAITGLELGWLARLVDAERDYLSLDVQVSNKNITAVDIVGFVEDVIDDVDASLVRKSNTLRSSTGLRYAHGFSDLFGIVANANFGFGESARRGEEGELFAVLGAQLDFDLAAWREIPLNIALGYQFDSYPEASEEVDGSIYSGYVRFGFIARDDFTIGLQFSGSSVPLVGDGNRAEFAIVEFDFRYFF